jgi:hypothetical protein
MDEINEKLIAFQYGRNDKKNQIPSNVFQNSSIDKNGSFKLTATHMWLFIRVFPLIFGNRLRNNENYLHFCLLIEIFLNLNGDSYKEEKIKKIEEKINNYLTWCVILYPNKNVTAKQHFLVHYGRAIRRFGPPKGYSTIRFESKYSFLKNINNKTKNRINLTRKLAEKHQISQFYHLRSVNFLLDVQFSKSVTSDTDQFVQAILDSDNVIFFKSLIYKGIDYHVGDIIYYNGKFNQINKIILPAQNNVTHKYTRKMKTMTFCYI